MYSESIHRRALAEPTSLTPTRTTVRTVRQESRRLKCIDAGSDYCPCHLAQTGECIVCSVIRGEAECNCSWTGTCILAQSQWLTTHGDRRESQRAKILDREDVGQQTEILHIGTTEQMACQLTRPGSFVFVRGRPEECFDTPLAVVQACPGRQKIILAYTKLGPKTKTLASCNKELWLRGPYWNGILGHDLIENVRDKRVVLVLSGMAQVCGPNIARTLIRNNNRVSVIYGSKEYPFVVPYLQDVSTAHFVNLATRLGWQEITALFQWMRPSCIFSGGNDEQHALLKKAMTDQGLTPRLATSKIHKMCCGEGICGACITLSQGAQIRPCKTCLDPEE